MQVIIDGDYLVYAAGFAGEHTRYLVDGVRYEERPDKAIMAEAKDVWTKHELEPIENVLHSAKLMLTKIVAQCEVKFGKVTDTKVFLTGTANYRERIATIRPYKGNRDPRHKPAYMRQIREYLCKQWSAEVVNWYEADDRVSILQTADPANTVVCGIDKDLLQVPGWHFVPGKGFKQITPRQGLLRLYYQILAGDATDNVGGCYKIGATKAAHAVKLAAVGTADSELPSALWRTTLDMYTASIEQYGDVYGGLSAEAAAIENAWLVHMLREEPEDYAFLALWEPPV